MRPLSHPVRDLTGRASELERRMRPAEMRARGRRLEGHAAVFGALAEIGGGLTERIAPGAFADSLASRGDILALVDHDPTRVLARTASGSLRLAEDSLGLAFDLDLPETQAARDVMALAERGDIGGMSFGFIATDDARDGTLRTLRSVDLLEISVVSAWPAYSGTAIHLRSGAPRRVACLRALRILDLEHEPSARMGA
ncbi:MAG: HK97 family phage prohead protease [Pseudomonadota bacterium]